MTGTMDKAKGSVKEATGKVVGDKQLEAEGKMDKVKGHVKDAAHNVKEAAKGARDKRRE
ncbi:MAG: CsbD family protein [Hyphomicrobiales bacterium]|nr:CsbD family protein [Hyphomicrobiales bacterium]